MKVGKVYERCEERLRRFMAGLYKGEKVYDRIL